MGKLGEGREEKLKRWRRRRWWRRGWWRWRRRGREEEEEEEDRVNDSTRFTLNTDAGISEFLAWISVFWNWWEFEGRVVALDFHRDWVRGWVHRLSSSRPTIASTHSPKLLK